MQDSNSTNNKASESLLWLIGVTILIATILVIISFTIFIKSGAYDTIQQIIRSSNTFAEDDLKGYDVTSPVQSEDLKNYGDSLESRIRILNSSEDFNQEQLSDEALGI